MRVDTDRIVPAIDAILIAVKQDTGLTVNVCIVVQSNKRRKTAFVLVNPVNVNFKDKNVTSVVAVEDKPHVVEGPELTASNFRLVSKWVYLNKDLLNDYYFGVVTSSLQFSKRLKRIKRRKLTGYKPPNPLEY